MGDVQHLDGYGASIEYDDELVRLIAGKAQAKIWHAGAVAFPVDDIIALEYRPANPFINGQLKFETIKPADAYAPLGREMLDYVPDNGLIIHWRRKDQAAFAALHDALAARVDPGQAEQKRAQSAQARADYKAQKDALVKQAIDSVTKREDDDTA